MQEYFDKPPEMSEYLIKILKQFTEACVDFAISDIDATKIETHEDVEKCTQYCVRRV
ncbi:hypothetical protein LCGC14_1582390 [marine sediment metagenome]|uniref:Uncharacterized protein n=1 Tax=marine sediment metagenome TaxID=412755 RepID=A0A0F9LGQ3_9ZZZZ